MKEATASWPFLLRGRTDALAIAEQLAAGAVSLHGIDGHRHITDPDMSNQGGRLISFICCSRQPEQSDSGCLE